VFSGESIFPPSSPSEGEAGAGQSNKSIVLIVTPAQENRQNEGGVLGSSQLPNAKRDLYFQSIAEWGKGMNAIFMEDPLSSIIGEERARKMLELSRRVLAPLGSQVLPYLVVVSQEDYFIGGGIHSIAKFLPHNVIVSRKPRNLLSTTEEFPEVIEQDVRYDPVKILLLWWLEGEKRTPQWFAGRYHQWLTDRAQGKADEAKEAKIWSDLTKEPWKRGRHDLTAYQKLLDIGIAAMPLWLEKLGTEKDASIRQAIVEALSALTEGEVKPTMSVPECLSWWKANKEKWTIPFPKGKREFLQWLAQEALWEEQDRVWAVAPVKTISRVEDEEAIEMLVRLLKHPKPAVRAQSLEQLQKLFGEQLPEGYTLGVGTEQWEKPSDLMEMKKYDVASKRVKKMWEKMRSDAESSKAAEDLTTWWQNSKGKVTIHWQRAWVELP
jgi:hypothetical protein